MQDSNPIETMRVMMNGTFGRVFEYMEIADAELARAGVKENGFRDLFPGPFLRVAPELYRAHARELAERMRDGVSLERGTRAEVMLAMIDASLASPLTRAGQAVYEHLFVEMMPNDARKLGIVPTPGMYPQQVEEDIRAAQNRLIGKRAKCA